MKNTTSVSEKNKERGIGQFIVYAILAAAIIAASVKWKSRFTADSIVFKGTISVTEADLRAYIKQDTSTTSTQQFELATLRALILRHPMVMDANVVHADNHTVVVTITERQPVLLIASSDGTLRYVDSHKSFIPYHLVRSHADVPLIYGISDSSLECDTTTLNLLLESFITVTDAQSPMFLRDVSEIRIDENRMVTLVTADEHIRVRCGVLSNLTNAKHKLEAFYRYFNRTQRSFNVRTIDLRWNNTIITS